MFTAKAGTNYDGINIPTLPPGIYKDAKLIDIKKDTTTPADASKEGTKILAFTWETSAGLHQHTEYEIKADDAKLASKADSMVKRFGHILSQYGVSQAVLDAMPAQPDFDSYCNWFMATIGQSYVGVVGELKIIGNVYNNKATADVPGYIPFLATGLGKTKSLSFSNNEVSQNKQYADHYAKTSGTQTPDAEGTAAAPVTRDADF